MRKQAALVIAVLVVGVAYPAVAQESVGSPNYTIGADNSGRASSTDGVVAPENWGGASLTALDKAAIGFSPLADGQWSHFSSGWSQRSGGTNNATCMDVNLPTGAVLTNITTFTNDTDGAADITYTLFSINLVTSVGSTPFNFVTAGTPGIQRVIRAVTPNVTINNNHNAYALCIFHGSATATNQSAGATFWYRLQVSAAPAVATFPSDVPTTHPFFRFVEALAASGITGGCGAGAFCPDSPVTRGQISVFLATALGLHFPN